MKYKLINSPNQKYSAKEQILINRGVAEKDLYHYTHLTDDDINKPEIFGDELIAATAKCLQNHIDRHSTICIVVDCDCDGYTSSAILINYLFDMTNEDYINDKVSWYMHEGKQHGLNDCFDWIEDIGPDLVIIPDAGSNDIKYLQELEDKEIDVIILDHHEIEETDFWNTICHPHLYLINSQLPQYPNKELSGAGVVYQFCRYVDQQNKTDYADWYLDLCALGLDGDMMSLQSFETRRLITKGLDPANIHNPFIYGMWEKNKFKLGDNPTAWGATFYIVPLVNAITRSGTLEEKELVFNSMLKFKAFKEIPSNKRGHKLGEMEQLITQAIRTCTNVKNRQTRDEEKALELVEHLIEDNNMMEHKVLLFLLEPGAIKAEIRGLVANKLMAKYQRPCCMLTKVEHEYEGGELEYSSKSIFPILHYQGEKYITYEGSARGCDKVGVTEFKDICAATQVCEYTIGHQGAFGLGLREENIDKFIKNTDFQLENMASEPIYYVDYIWRANEVDPEAILEIAEFEPYIGKDMDEPLIALEKVQITKDNIVMMASNTVKITLPNNVSIIKFRMSDEEYNQLYSEYGYTEINVIGKCNVNEWGGNRYAQILIQDFEIINKCAYIF